MTRPQPRPNRRPRLAYGALGTLLTVAGASAGCGQQAGADYLGQPLLSMHGQATVSALTGGQAVVPALCFVTEGPAPAPLDFNKLPADIRMDLANAEANGGVAFFPAFAPPSAMHILDVQSHGEFPAQFDIDVYLPPVDAALSDPLFDGEPRSALGSVCAVTMDHAAVTHTLASGVLASCDDTTCYRDQLIESYDTPRFYSERYTSPASKPDDSSKVTEGDPTLQYENVAESVVGTTTEDFGLVYLASTAAAGSYTAWRFGSRDALSAGYHLFAPGAEAAAPADANCNSALSDALTEIKAKYEPEIKQQYGDSATLDMFPLISGVSGGTLQTAPPDVVHGGNRIWMRLQMERCPLPSLREVDPATSTLSIEIRPGPSTAGSPSPTPSPTP